LKRTYLVTGGSGLIGGYVSKALIERNDNVVIMDVKPPSPPRMAWVMGPIWDKVTFVEGSASDDLPSLMKVCKDYHVERIFHAAALFRTDFELSHPYYSFHVTIQGMLNVCETARILGLERVVFAGTVGEYIHGTIDYGSTPLDETMEIFDPAMGTQPYSASKMIASIIGMSYWQTQGVDWLNTRFSRVWGFGSKRETMQTEGLMIENAVDGTVTRLEKGDEKRGQTYVKDLVRGVLMTLDADSKKLKHRVFNVGGDIMASDRDVAAVVKEFIPEAKIEIGEGGVSRRPFSTELAKRELGWKSAYNLKEAVKDYINTYREFKLSELE
jgi:nucleoside-diphosphate-sugar epimerase